MKKGTGRSLWSAICLLGAFLLWTVAICFIDVQSIGPLESSVGFATVNQFIHNLTGVHMTLYTLTDWLGLIPLGFIMGFALLGLTQWIKRKHLAKVDYSILVLGVFYVVLLGVYALFEVLIINYRPVLIGGILEASYPSSTTMLVMCVMPTAAMELHIRTKSNTMRHCVSCAMTVFVVFMVVGRFLSGVHWCTDIIGGILLSAGLVALYRFIIDLKSCH